jgi:hypothetical protein
MGADSLLSSHFKLNFWNISFNDLLTYQVSASNDPLQLQSYCVDRYREAALGSF